MSGNGFPDMSEVLDDFSETVSFAVIGKSVDDFEVVEKNKDTVEFDGVLQPMPAQKIAIKSEGQRSWKWWTLWTENLLDLDDVMRDEEGIQYRVMSRSDWRKGGYLQYELTQGPKIEQ